MEKMKLGLIGYGYWGPNLARIISESDSCELKYCADLVEASRKQVKDKYPGVTATADYHEILNDKEVKAVFIVTPTKSHYRIAKDCLEAGKHVFIEKPLTYGYKEAEELVAMAAKKKVTLMVGHLFLYNSAVRYIKDFIDSGELGTIRHLHFQRRNLGPIRSDVNVMWDLAPHDISMLLYFLKEKPVSVTASGECYLQKGIQDVVSASIRFEHKVMANIILSWIDPIKIRDITLVGSKKMLLFDDVHVSEKIKIFDKNANIIEKTRDVSFSEFQIAVHSGGITIPAINYKEPLKEEFMHFIDCIRNGKKPLTDGRNGADVVRLLEAMQKSLDNNSALVTL